MIAAEVIEAGLAAIEAIVGAIRNSNGGKVDTAEVLAKVQSLQDAINANNAAADAALAAKFPGQ